MCNLEKSCHFVCSAVWGNLLKLNFLFSWVSCQDSYSYHQLQLQRGRLLAPSTGWPMRQPTPITFNMVQFFFLGPRCWEPRQLEGTCYGCVHLTLLTVYLCLCRCLKSLRHYKFCVIIIILYYIYCCIDVDRIRAPIKPLVSWQPTWRRWFTKLRPAGIICRNSWKRNWRRLVKLMRAFTVLHRYYLSAFYRPSTPVNQGCICHIFSGGGESEFLVLTSRPGPNELCHFHVMLFTVTECWSLHLWGSTGSVSNGAGFPLSSSRQRPQGSTGWLK